MAVADEGSRTTAAATATTATATAPAKPDQDRPGTRWDDENETFAPTPLHLQPPDPIHEADLPPACGLAPDDHSPTAPAVRPPRPTSPRSRTWSRRRTAPQRNDEYYWLRDDARKNPEMLAYLNAENAYVDASMKALKPLENTLYDEIVGRIKQDDSSVPYRERGYWYYSRFETGQDYPIHARRSGSMDARRGGAARRQRDGQGQGLFQRRRLGGQPGQPPAGLGRGRDRPPPVHDPGQEPRHRRGLSPTASAACRPTWSGPTTTRRCSTSRTTRRPC